MGKLIQIQQIGDIINSLLEKIKSTYATKKEVEDVNTTIGSLNSLNTNDKSSVISAINEINNKLGDGLSQLSDLYNDSIKYL